MKIRYIFLILFLALGWLIWTSTGATFWKVLIMHPKEVAAFSPCSWAVAQEVSSCIEHHEKPLRILEVGGGTGALTAGIVERMQPGDVCDVIEIMPVYCQILRECYEKYPGVFIHCCSILDWHAEPYDVIICSLPFNTFQVGFVDDVLSHLKNSIKPQGKLSYIELLWISEWKKYFISQEAKDSLAKTLHRMKEFRTTYGKKTTPIYWNITPIAVHHLEIV